ncbi:MAG: putative glycosyltransferase [Friedmanniella sp.]|nr:putative glycosyltransferase [Friedmanniella sp.]
MTSADTVLMSPVTLDPWPGVSVVMPVLNEERHLAAAVREVLDQAYDGPFEVLLCVGPSRDATHEIAAGLARADARIRVVDNPAARTPSALNLGVAAARYDIIVRVDGHGELTEGYVRRAVELLAETGAANVGGVMDARGQTAFEEAVATAYTTKLGLGGSAFHLAESPAGPAETVFLGVFRKEALAEIGGFDETMHRAQDWELNYRLRQGGRLIWFSPDLRVTYRPRSSLSALLRQMYETGKWRREVVRRYPETASVRYLAPPVAVSGVALGSLLGLVGLLTGSRLLRAGLVGPLGYLALVVAGSTVTSRTMSDAARLRLPLVLAATHMAWGAGFLVGLRDRRPAA